MVFAGHLYCIDAYDMQSMNRVLTLQKVHFYRHAILIACLFEVIGRGIYFTDVMKEWGGEEPAIEWKINGTC